MMPSNQNQVPIAPGMVPIANQNVPSPSNSNMVPIGAPVSSIPGPNMVPVNPAPGAIPQTISNPPPQQAPSSSHQNNQQQQAQQHDLPRLKNLICFLKESLIVIYLFLLFIEFNKCFLEFIESYYSKYCT